MFEDPLCRVSKSLGIHGVNTARPRGRKRFTLGNFISDATMRPSHGRPSGHRPTVRPSVCYRPRDNPARTVMSIVQHSAPAEWMVAIVGLTHMVPSLVDNGMHRITVFEGNQDIRLQLLSSVEEKEGSSRGRKRSARAGGKDEAGGDGSNSGTSNTSEENPSSHEEVDEVSLETRFPWKQSFMDMVLMGSRWSWRL
jgi:hypothetical protein